MAFNINKKMIAPVFMSGWPGFQRDHVEPGVIDGL
jgi:hypothetical protein